MPAVELDVGPGQFDFEIRLSQCPETIRLFVNSLVSVRWISARQVFVGHVCEFRWLKEYLDSVDFHDRDASDGVIDRIKLWNDLSGLDFKIKSGDFNSDLRPEDLKAIKTNLYSDQVTGVRFLTSRHRSLLADSMGLGKSAATISTFAALNARGMAERALVVGISAVRPEWEKEVYKHSNFTVTVLPNGTKEILAAMERYARSPTHFLVTHYEAISTTGKKSIDGDKELSNPILEAILAHPFDLVIADEAHLLKNMTTRRYKCFSYLLSKIRPSIPLLEVECETEEGTRFTKMMSANSLMTVDEGEVVDIL